MRNKRKRERGGATSVTATVAAAAATVGNAEPSIETGAELPNLCGARALRKRACLMGGCSRERVRSEKEVEGKGEVVLLAAGAAGIGTAPADSTAQ
ncbi:hypothetical protein MRX96_043325 [Rhipicephalus microplus]